MLVDLLRALSRASKRTQYHPITFGVTSRTKPFRGSERVIWGGLVATGAYARVGGDYFSVAIPNNSAAEPPLTTQPSSALQYHIVLSKRRSPVSASVISR